MSTNSGQEAKFSLVLDDQVSSAATSAGDSLDSLRQRIAGGEDAIKNMRAAFNSLRGSTDAVKAAKAELTAKLNSERDAVSAANLQLLKSGSTYNSVAAKAKKLATEQEALKKSAGAEKAKSMSAALSAAGGPVGGLVGKLQGLKDMLGGAGGKMGAMTFAAAGLVAAALAVVAAVGAATYALGRWIVTSANTARSAGLVREAFAGSAKNAANLGTQVDALAAKVPTSKAALNDLAVALMKSKLGGQATVDTFNAVGQASAALGDEAGGKIKEFIERGRLMGRMHLDPREMLEGFGDLNFDDVAKALAKNTGKTVQAAANELRTGRTKLGDGAKAMRDAVEKKFGGLNLRKMMSLEVLSEKLKEKLADLTSGVNLEPLLKGFASLSEMFDSSSVTGAALKSLMTAFGNTMGSLLTASMPFIKQFMRGMILGALDLGIGLLQLRNWLRRTFGDSKVLSGINWMNMALEAGKATINVVVASVILLAAGVALLIAPFVALYVAWQKAGEAGTAIGTAIRKFFMGLDLSAAGVAIVDGLIAGLKAGAKKLYDAVRGLGDGVKKAFTGKLEIQSPSKAFFRYGENIDEGAAQGVERNGRAQSAVDGMVSTPASSSAKAGSVSATSGDVTVNFVYQAAAGAGGDVASQVNESSVRAALVKIIQEAAIGRGVPVAA